MRVEILQFANLLLANGANSTSNIHLQADIAQQPLVTGDHDFFCPVLWLNTQQFERQGKILRILHYLIDERVYTVHESTNDIDTIGMVVLQLFPHCAAEFEQPGTVIPF